MTSLEMYQQVMAGKDLHQKRLASSLEIENEVVDKNNLNKIFSTLEDRCLEVFKEYFGKNEYIGHESLHNGKHNQKIESCGTKEKNLEETTKNYEKH